MFNVDTKAALPTLISSRQTAYVKHSFIDRLISLVDWFGRLTLISDWFNTDQGFLVTMDIEKSLKKAKLRAKVKCNF